MTATYPTYTSDEDFRNNFRVGRCNHCARRPSYYWPATSGLRLDDVRCPRCRHLLDRTSREAHNMRGLTYDEITAARDTAIAAVEAQVAEYEEAHAAWVAEADITERGSDQWFVVDLNLDRYGKLVKSARGRLARLQRAAAVSA